MARFALGGSAVRSYGSVLYALVLSRMRAGRRQALMISVLLLTLPLLIVSGLSYNRAQAAINEQLNFQARLLTTQGNTPTDGDYHVRFRIYCGGDGALAGAGSGADCNHATDEDLLWTETWTTGNLVEVKNGYLSVRLGSITAFGSAIDWNEEELYLSIEIGGNSGTASWDGEMDPFMRLTSTPYAFNAGALDGLDSTDFVQIDQGEQAVNSASTLISIDQTGAGDLIDLQVSNSSVFTLANNGNLTVTGSGTFQGINAGSGLIQGTGGLTIGGTITFSSLTNCDTIDTDGSGVLSCGTDDGGGGGSVDDLDDAYNNFGANPAVITIDAAESQTGGLEFALNTTDNFIIDLQSTGDFVLQDNNSTFLTISDDGSFDYTLDATDNPTFTVTNQGSGDITYNLAGSGDFVIQDNGTPVFTVGADGNATFANDLTVSGNLALGFTQGSVAFQGASGLTQDNANLFWDDTNNKLGIGTATPHADAFGGLELVISEASAGATAGISVQSGASLETQFILRANDSNGYTELATLGTGNALLLYTNGLTRAIFPSTGGFVVGGTLTDAAFGTLEARGSTSASVAINPRTAGGTGDLVFYEADAAQTGFRYDGTTNTTYFRDFANSANRLTFTQAGDLYVSANGGTTGSPRTMAFNNLTAGEAVRFQFGDAYSAFQNQFGGSLDIYAYHSIRLVGDRNAASALTFSTESNIGTHVINTIAASEALVVSAAASQSADLFVVEDSTGTNLFEINSDGTFSFNTSVYDCSSLDNGGVLTVNASGNVVCEDDDGGVGSGGVDSLNSLTGAITLQGTTNEIAVNTSSPNITISLPDTVILGDTTNAGILELNDSSANAYKTILQSADLTTFAGNLTLTLPANAGNSGQCLKTDGSGVLSFSNCNNGSGGGGAITLQDAYEAGNFITTDDGGTYGDIQFTLADTATDRNFTVTTATGAAGYTYLSRADGAGTVDPAQLLLVEDLDVNRTIADGIKVQAAFGITDGIDVSDAELTNAINIGANAIAGTNFNVSAGGAIVGVGLNAGTGLIQGTGGLTVSGTITFSSLVGCDTIDTDGSGVLSCGTDASGGGGVSDLQGAYDGGNTIVLASNNAVRIQDNATPITGNLFEVTNNGGATNYLSVSTSTVNIGTDLVVSAGNTLRLVGDTTVNRPAGSPGELYYDTDTDTLLTYNGTKWQADRGEYIIVASGHGSDPSTQAERDSADYVTDGTSDETEINSALSAAAGGKVLLLGGTYVIDGSISVPNNTTLAGVGPGTNIEVDNIDVDIDAIINTDTTAGTGVVIRDLTLNGRDDLNLAGVQRGIYFNNMGDGSGGSATVGGRIDSVTVRNFRTYGMLISSSNNNTVTNSTFLDNNTAIFTNSSSANNTFTSNLIQGNSGSGIYLAGGTDTTITGNTIEGNSYGVRLDTAFTNTVTGNTLSGNTNSAVYIHNSSTNNTVSSNNISDSGGSTDNDAILIDASDYNVITSNRITDSAGCSTTCSAINIVNSTSNNNYLEGNIYSGEFIGFAAYITDAGTGTIYANQQVNSANGSGTNDVSEFRFRGSSDSANGFAIQNANGVDVLNIDTANGELEVGDYNGGTNPINGVIVFNNSTNANTVTVQSGATSTSYTLTLPTALGNSGDCLVDTNGSGVLGFTSCGGGGSLFTDGGTFTYLTSTTDDLVLGSDAVATASLYFDTSAANLYLGTNEALDGVITLYSSGVSITDPTISANSTGDLTLSAPSGSVVVGSGSGNIELSLSNPADLLVADKTATIGAAYSANDFTFTRDLTNSVNTQTMGGSVFSVTDTSTAVAGTTINYDLIFGNANPSQTFTGNLLRLQNSGNDSLRLSSNNLLVLGNSTSTNQSDIRLQNASNASSGIDFYSGSSQVAYIYRPANTTDLAIFSQALTGDIVTFNTSTGSTTLGNDSLGGILRVSDGTSNYVSIDASGVGTNYTLTLPTAVGGDGDCLKQTGATGDLIFGSCGSGGSLFTQGSGFAYLTTTTDELVVGASTSQSAKLAVVGDADETQLRVRANATQTTNLAIFENSAGNPLITFSGTGGAVFNEQGNDADFRVESDTIPGALFVQGSDGFVGIGTQTPGFKLNVVSDGSASFISNDAYGDGTVFQGRRANGTAGSPSALASADLITQFSARGYGTTGFSGTRASVGIYATQNWTDTAQGSRIDFFTTANDSTTLTRRLRVDNDGRVIISSGSPATNSKLIVENNYSSGTASTLEQGIQTTVGNTGTATVTDLKGIQTNLANTGGGTVEYGYGIYIAGTTNTASTINNLYGLYIGDQSTAGATAADFNIYSQGANSTNYLQGSTGVGDDTPDAKLDVQTDAGTIGLIVQGAGSQTADLVQVLSSAATEYFSIDASGNIFFTQLDCSGNTNGGALTTDANGQISCSNDDGGGSSLFTDGGTFAYLTTTTDDLVVGASTSQSAKLAVVGDADEVQVKVFANATQTTNVLEVNTSAGSGGDLLRLNSSGNLYVGGDISIDETDQLILDANTGSNSYIQQSDNGIEFISDGVQVFKARNTGRVGIGTFNPQARLEVDVADTANVPALTLDMNDVTNNPVVIQIENSGTGADILFTGDTSSLLSAEGTLIVRGDADNDSATDIFAIQGNGSTAYFTVLDNGNVSVANNLNINGGSLQTNSVARLDNSGNLVNIGNLTASGAITISSTGAGNDLTLSSPDQIVLSGFNCSTFTNGGALTTDASGNITCSNDDGGGSAINLDDAYNNFGATASKINVDSAESQTGGLEFELTGTNDFIVDIQGTGSFQVQDAGGATPAFYVNSDGETALNSTTTNALLHINGNGTYSAQQSLVRLGGALDNAGGTLSVFEIGTDIDTGNLQHGYGLDIDQIVVLDSGETTSSYRGIYVRAPSTSGTGSLTDSYGIYIADYDGVGGTGLNQSLRVDGQSRFSKNVGIGQSPSTSNMLTIDTDPGDNAVGLRILQQDTTNNPTALQVTNGGTGDSLEVENGTGNTFVVTHDGIVVLGGNNITNSELRIYDGDATANYVGLKSRTALASNYTLTLPSTAPGVNECLKAGGTTATDLVFGSCGSGSGAFTSSGGNTYLNTISDDVGIGTASPQAKLHVVESGTAGTPAINAVTSAVFQRSGAASASNWVSIISGNTGVGRLNFGDTDSDNVGGLEYDHALNNLVLRASGADILTIASDRNHFFDNNNNHSLTVEARGSSAVGRSLSISAGDSFSGGTAADGGVLNLAGGDALGTGNANGGNVAINGGAGTGSGLAGNVVLQGSNGALVGIGDDTPDAKLDVQTEAGTVGLIVQGAASQTADMVQVLNSSGLELLEIQDDGTTKFQVDTNSQIAFQVQNAAGQAYLTVDTENSTDALSVKIGAGADNVLLVLDSIPAASEPTGIAGAMYYDSTNNRFRCYTTSWVNCDTTGGGGGIAVTLTRIPEYAGGTLYADGTNNSGTITAGYVSGLSAGQGYKHNYYEWTSGQGSQQDYDIVVHVQLPSDYQSMGAASTFSFWHWDDDGTGTDAEIDWALYDVDETQCFSTTDINASAADTWEQESASSLGSCSFAADDIITFRFKLKTNSTGGSIRLGEFQFEYNN